MPSVKVLIVEDEPAFAGIIATSLDAVGYEVAGSVQTAADAIQQAKALSPDVILMDINLQGPADGIEAAEEIHRTKAIPVVFMTGLSDDETVQRAKQAGPFGYLVKPFHLKELAPTIELALYKRKKEREREELLSKTLGGCVEVLTQVLSTVDHEAFGQSQKIRQLAKVMAEQLIGPSTWELEVGAMLANIGFLSVPSHVVQKYRNGIPLALMEKAMITRVPEFGSNLLMRIPNLESVSKIVLYQSKNFDGSGFPKDAVSGLDIPLGARVLKVLNNFIAMEAAGTSKAIIIEHLNTSRGVYDPHIAREAIRTVIDAPPAGSKAVLLKELGLGDVLKAAIETTDGTVLVAPGIKFSSLVLDKLNNFSQVAGIKEPIYVEAESESNAERTTATHNATPS